MRTAGRWPGSWTAPCTGHDADNRAAVRAVSAEEMPLVGLAVYGPKNAVDKIFKGFPLHP